MLGVRRTTVTVVANVLQQAGLIRYHREADRDRGPDRARGEGVRILRPPFAARSARSRPSRADSGKHRPPALKARRPSSLPFPSARASAPGLCRVVTTAARRRFAIGPLRLPAGPLQRLVRRRRPQSAGGGNGASSDDKLIVAHNRKARFNYQIGETLEAGIALTGTEVKSLRQGKATIAEAYADSRGGEIWLVNSNIPEYLQAGRFNHAPKRVRKLLLHRRQINKLIGAVEREGMTLVPLKLYFNEKGRAKLELALARGKKLHDKRETERKRSWERERGRLLRAKG